MLQKKLAMLAVAVLVAVGLSPLPASAASVLKFSHPYTAGDARDLWAHRIKDLVEERSHGAIKIDIYPNAQLFKAQAQFEGVASGQIDLAIYPLTWLGGKAPVTEIGALPGILSNTQDGLVWRKRAVWPLLQEQVARTGVVLGGLGWGMGTIGSRQAPIIVPSDLKGLKMRGLGKATDRMMADYGATISSVPASEIYVALQTGALDGVMTIYSSFTGFRLYEVLKYLAISDSLVGAAHSIIVSPATLEKLGPDQSKLLMDAIADSEPYFASLSEQEIEATEKEFTAKGVAVHRLTPAEAAEWHKAAENHAWTYFRDNIKGGRQALEAVSQPNP
jgi:TRAP-type transport system periplasmic protein